MAARCAATRLELFFRSCNERARAHITKSIEGLHDMRPPTAHGSGRQQVAASDKWQRATTSGSERWVGGKRGWAQGRSRATGLSLAELSQLAAGDAPRDEAARRPELHLREALAHQLVCNQRGAFTPFS